MLVFLIVNIKSFKKKHLNSFGKMSFFEPIYQGSILWNNAFLFFVSLLFSLIIYNKSVYVVKQNRLNSFVKMSTI